MRIAISCYLLPPQRKYSSDDWLERRKKHLSELSLYGLHLSCIPTLIRSDRFRKEKGQCQMFVLHIQVFFLNFSSPPFHSFHLSLLLYLSFLPLFCSLYFFLSALPLFIQGGWANDINKKNNSDKSKKIIKKHNKTKKEEQYTNKLTNSLLSHRRWVKMCARESSCLPLSLNVA